MQGGWEFKTSLGYIMSLRSAWTVMRPCFEKNPKQETKPNKSNEPYEPQCILCLRVRPCIIFLPFPSLLSPPSSLPPFLPLFLSWSFSVCLYVFLKCYLGVLFIIWISEKSSYAHNSHSLQTQTQLQDMILYRISLLIFSRISLRKPFYFPQKSSQTSLLWSLLKSHIKYT